MAETIRRAFSLSSAGTAYQGAWRCSLPPTLFVGLHVIAPILALVNIGEADFPVFLWFIDAFEEPLSLLVMR